MSSDTESNDGGLEGMDRRSLLKRSALLGGALVWTTPVVQTIAQPAFAMGSDPGPLCRAGVTYTFQHVAANGFGTSLDRPCRVTHQADVTSDGSVVKSVVYSQIGGVGPYGVATIQLAPGYVLFEVQTMSAQQEGCGPVRPAAPKPDSTCASGYTYEVRGTKLNSAGKPTNIMYLTGAVRCVGCA